MFAYCANEPINSHDPSGFLHSRAFENLGGVGGGAAVIPMGTAFVDCLKGLYYATVGTISVIGIAATNAILPKAKPQNIGRAKNKLKPDINATGDHSTYKRDPVTGEITNYKTYKPNIKNPSGYDEVKGYDGKGKPHTNPVTGESLFPHVHDKTVPGEAREPYNWEVPGN